MAALLFLTGGTDASVTSATTASISPTANRPVFVVVASALGGGSAPNAPTVSGAGLTWAQVASATQTFTDGATGTGRLTIFRGVSASPSAGTLGLDFAAVSQQSIGWTVLDGEDCTTVVQADVASGTSTSAGVTLSSFASATNIVLLAAATLPDAVTFTPDGALTGFTAQSAVGTTHRAAWDDAADTTPSFTVSASEAWGAVGIEITTTGGGGGSTQPPRTYNSNRRRRL